MKVLTVVLAIYMLSVIGCSNDNDAKVEELENQIQEFQQAQVVSQTATPTLTAVATAVATPVPTSTPSPTPTPTPTAKPIPILQPMVRGQKDSAIEVTVYNAEKVWPGTTLLSDHHDVGSPRIIEVNMLGEVTWQYVLAEEFKQYANPGQDVERLANGNTLLVLPGKGIVEISSEGDVVWSHMDEKVSHDADRLANGNTLYAFGNNDGLEDAQAKEVTPDGELVWQWYAKDYFNKEPYVNLSRNGWAHTNAVERLESGNTLISPRNFDLLVEVDSEGAVVRTFGDGMLVDAHDPEFLSTGNILVSNQVKPHEALEFDPDTNKIIWRFVPPYRQIANSFSVSFSSVIPVMMPIRDVDRLPNGNVLITGYPFIIEVTRDREIVWQLQYADMESVVEGRSGEKKLPKYGFYKAQRISVT
ncbi:MAG: aryl-sulfate sulfotransferase, partial [SAR202 cluster bacterium]|nr:aryl-sulfate sulfotransferase [SAR202 cluster bacterium]